MFLFETLPCIIRLIPRLPFTKKHLVMCKIDQIIFHWDTKKIRKALPERKNVRINK